MIESAATKRQMNRQPDYWQGWPLVGWSALALILMVAMLLAIKGIKPDGFRLVIRTTAQTSFGLFLSAFVASSLYRLWPSGLTRWLRQNRRYLGVSFGVSHTLHALAILGLAYLTAGTSIRQTEPAEFIGGLLAYLLIAAMVATSFDRTAAWLGRGWSWLHRLGMSYIWLVFLFSYGGRAVQSWAYAPLAGLLLLAAGLRVWSATRRSPNLARAKTI